MTRATTDAPAAVDAGAPGTATAPMGAAAPERAAAPEPAAAPLADVDTVLLDLDGCLWFGEALAEGAAELVDALRASGRRVGFLTNTSNSRAVRVAAKLRRLGIAAETSDVVMPVEVLAEHPRLRDRPRVWFLGPEAVRQMIGELTPLAERPEDAELLLLARDTAMTYHDLADALHALLCCGAMLALNVDPRVPVEGGRMLPGTGAIAAALSYASGIEPEIVGKPSSGFFETALRRFGGTADRAVIVGDTLDSDIAGGAGAGLRTVLVGVPVPSTRRPEPVPDHRVADLAGVWALFGGERSEAVG